MRTNTRLLAMIVGVGLLGTACGSTPDEAADDTTAATETVAGDEATAEEQTAADDESTADESAAGDGCSGVGDAQAFLSEYRDSPAQLDIEQALSQTPEPGARVVRLLTPVPVAVLADEASADAAEALGWDYSTISVESGAEGIQRAFDSALALDPAPDAIIMSGFPAVTYGQQLAQAKERGIQVIANSVTDVSGTPETPDAVITGGQQTERWGQMVASYVIANSDGPANAAVFNISAYPVLQEFQAGFEATIDEWCPEASITVVDQQPSDIGTNTPQSVVSTFQADPELDWAIFAIGDMTIGVPAALASAGLTDRVRIAGESATEANIEAVRRGEEEAWTGYASPYLGWAAVDAAARLLVGDDIAPAEEAFAPTQIITADNVDSIATTEGGYYIGLEDYAEQFKALWGVE